MCFYMKYLLLIAVLSFLSCKKDKTDKYITSRNEIFDVYDKIKEVPMEEVLISRYGKMCLLDSFLIIKDNSAPDKQIHLFNKNNFRHVISTTRIGQGPKEIVNLVRIVPDEKNKRFFAIDGGKRKLLAYNLDSLLTDSNYVFTVKANLKDDYAGTFVYINDTLAIAQFLDFTVVIYILESGI